MSEDHHHPYKTGHSKVDMIVAVVALVMSAVSVFIAIHHGKTMEKMVTATTWPYVQLQTSNADTNGGNTRLTLTAANSGVGPARIKKAVMRYDGKPVTSSAALLKACCEGTGELKHQVFYSSINHRVISGQQQVDYLTMLHKADNDALYARFEQAREKINMALCYCSVFDECWITDSSTPEPSAVTSCEALQGAEYTE